MRPSNRDEFAIAIICALTFEAEAVEDLFDETYDRLGKYYGKEPGDDNAYVNGRIGNHSVVVCYLPGMGKGSAGSVASSLKISYKRIEVALVVGICGGAPYPLSGEEIFLGDVIISDSVVQYDLGRQYPHGFERKTGLKDTLGRPNREIRSLLASLQAKRSRKDLQEKLLRHLQMLQESQPVWFRPATVDDILFEASYQHKHYNLEATCRCLNSTSEDICKAAVNSTCTLLGCDLDRVCRRRPSTENSSPRVHIGTVASADTVVKSGAHRDRLVQSEGVIGFEMEGAGVWDNISCIIIKGVCDYADSHKNKAWQAYAAATGASAAKTFLDYWFSGSGFAKDIQDELFDNEYTESSERKWIRVLNLRRMNNECFNCGHSGHYENTCYFDCGRCRERRHTQRYCRNNFNQGSDESEHADNGEERWNSILRSRIENNGCFNCGDGGHYEYSCHTNCARCKGRKSGHTQRNCPDRFGPAKVHAEAQFDTDPGDSVESLLEANLTNASMKTDKVAGPSPDQFHEYNFDEHSLESPPPSTIFDESGRTRQTLSSIETAFHGRTSATAKPLFHGPTDSPLEIPCDSSARNEYLNTNENSGHNLKNEHYGTDDSDVETTYSIDSNPDNQKFCFMRAFATQVQHDLECNSERLNMSNIDSSYLSSILKAFAWKLHGESSCPFEWEAAATLRQKQTEIIDLLIPGEDQADGEEDEWPRSPPFKKPRNLVSSWLDDVDDSTPTEEETDLNDHPKDIKDSFLPKLSDYEKFIRKSDAYQWLLLKLRQHGQLPSNESATVSDIGRTVWKRFRVLEPLHKLSRRRGSLVTIEVELDWRLMSYFNNLGFTSSDAFPERVLCLTGTPSEAQATTVIEYFRQTWPISGEHTIKMIRQLLNSPGAEDVIYHLPGPRDAKVRARIQSLSQCSISVTGSLYLVAEIAEQIGWLISGLQTSPNSQGIATCYPRIKNLDVGVDHKRTSGVVVIGTCRIVFDIEERGKENNSVGFCWGSLFSNITMIGGYPIPLRPNANTGLEISLGTMAYLVHSQQVVQWGARIMIKGFSSLLVATSATDSITVWHLFVSKCPDERISYVDSRLDTVEIMVSENHSLRFLEQTRHIVGWCSNITEFCGHSLARKAISGCGLPKPPPTMVIDRLYIEAGSEVVAGLNIGLNKRNQPIWLKRQDDYPTFLKWIGDQAIIFYDISEHRAWLVDGASALLHLLRASIYLDENDPESTYDWVFDIRELKDTWEACSGRIAALKTLKHPKNLELKLYVKNPGDPILQYETIRERVSKIMHSLDILVDSQAKASSQDGIRIPQTLKPQKGIAGFDILDVISPLGPIHTRMKHLSSLGPGWIDFIPSLEAITIFGNGFGDLIRPNDLTAVCCDWKSIPIHKEYLTASVSTIKMLYEKRLLRNEPGLCVGELTSKIIWTSESNPFKSCECLQDQRVGKDCHLNPVQYLLPKRSWRASIIRRNLAPVDLDQLEEKGAVVFGHLSFMGKVKEENKDNLRVRRQPSFLDGRSSSHGNTGSSTITSVESQSTRSTGMTQPSLDSSSRKDTVMTTNISSGNQGKNHMRKRTRVVWELLRKLPGFSKQGAAD